MAPPSAVVLSPFESLTSPLHGIICSYLPDGDKLDAHASLASRTLCARLCVSLASLALSEEPYGGSLTKLRVGWGHTHRIHALVSLVERQPGIEKVEVGAPEATSQQPTARRRTNSMETRRAMWTYVLDNDAREKGLCLDLFEELGEYLVVKWAAAAVEG